MQRRDGYRLPGYERSMPPREQPPNGQPPGVNPPPTTANPPHDYNPISVGPDASDGYGNTHVLGPPPVSAWSGWPDGWQTPPWNASSPAGLMGAWGRLADVVFAAIDLNTSILSTMPPYMVKDTQPQPGAPWLENPEPLVYASWCDFAKQLFWSYEACGEVFVVATARYADTGYPMRFMVVNPALVDVDKVRGVTQYAIAKESVADPADVLHIRYASWPGDNRGHGPLEAAGARLLAVDALARYSTSLADNGGLPPAVIKYPKRVTRVQMRQMQADYVEARRSALAVPAILADGAELDTQSSSVRDMALTDLQRFNEARVCVLLGVPPSLLGLPGDASTYTNSTNIFDFHWRAGLRPKAASVMAALSGWLLPRGTGIELNRDEYIRPGMFERAQAYSMLIASGVLSPAQVRSFERYAATGQGAAEALTSVQPAQPTAEPSEPFGTPG